MHTITYECNGEIVSDTINIIEDESITITCDNFLITSIDEIIPANLDFSVAPNPANDFITIKKSNEQEAFISLYNTLGIKVLEQNISGTQSEIYLNDLKGIFFLEVVENNKKGMQKIIINN